MGCADPGGHDRRATSRASAALRAGLPVTTAGTTVNRFCSSGLQAIALAARSIMVDGVPVVVAGGVESISLVQNEHATRKRYRDELDRRSTSPSSTCR